ncbi:MAG: SLBB domain-containing protein [Microcoleaceae cyanobacterium]
MFIHSLGYHLSYFTLITGISLTSTLPLLAQDTPPEPPPNTADFTQLEYTYTLGAGDRLQMSIFNVEKYTGEYLVLADGNINLPGVGLVSVQGLTLPQAQERIAQRYSALLKQPVVTLALVGTRSIQVAISGEVFRPGSYQVSEEQNNQGGGGQFPRLTSVITQAGGITQVADVTQIQLRRNAPNGTVVTLDLSELIQFGNLTQDPILMDGDSIYVPTAISIDPIQARQIISSNLAPATSEPVQVAVVGEVYRPGAYTVGTVTGTVDSGNVVGGLSNARDQFDPPTVTRAIQIAGGIQDLADIRNIEIRRITRTGLQTIEVNLWELLANGDINQDIFLQEGDTIVVPKADKIATTELDARANANFSPATINVNVVGEVVEPGIVEIPPNTPLNQALLAAGGFDRIRSSEGSVQLIRVNPDGTVTRRKIPIDFSRGISGNNNPIVRNNDIIVVNRSIITALSDTTQELIRPLENFLSLAAFFRVFFQTDSN